MLLLGTLHGGGVLLAVVGVFHERFPDEVILCVPVLVNVRICLLLLGVSQNLFYQVFFALRTVYWLQSLVVPPQLTALRNHLFYAFPPWVLVQDCALILLL